MLFTIVLHQSSFNLQNDYFWLLLDHILLQEEKPRSLLASYLELSKISNTEISKEILAGVHLAKNDREFLMVMLQKISHDTLVRIIDDERFLEHILVISKIKSKPSRSFYYAFLARYLSIMPAEEKATKAGLNILIKVFAFLQSHIKNQNDQNFYDILTAYIIHVSYDKISDTVFLEALILNAQEFYRHIQHYEESIDDVTEYLSFLPAGDADCKQYFRYFTQYYISFSKDAKQTLFHLKEMHLLLFHYIDDAHFPELLTTVKTVVFSQPLSQASGLDMFLLYPDVILRLLSLKIHRCTYSDINAFIQKIQPDMIPLTESAVNSVMTLIGIPISITSKHKLIIYLAHITVPLMISDQRLRDAFSRLTIDEILRLLEMKLPDIKTGHTNHKRIFMFIIEAAILSEASPRYDVHITRLIKKFGLHFSDSVIIEKFQRRTKLENEITRDISHFHTSIVSMMVDYYITGKPGRIIELAGIEHYKKIVQTLHEYDQHLHTSRGYPYYLPTKRKNGFYGLWRVVSPKALKNYLQYGHEINKSESRYTYLALKRSECFSLPDVYGFMVWIPAYVYNNFAVKSKVQTSVRERSTEEVVIDDDIPAENLKIFFVSEEIYRAHEKQFKDFSVLRLHAFTAYYRTTLRAPVTRYFRWNELRDVISIINSHQKERGARLAVIYAKSENLKKLKKTFSRRVFKETFPEYYINDIKKSSLIHHLQQYIITQPYGLLHLFTQNAYRRGVPRIKKTIRKGFNQGYLVLIQKKKFYGKTYDEPDRIRAEYLSWCIYKETGALVKDDVRLLHIEGRLILAGRWIHAPLYQTQRVPIEDLALDFILSCLIQDRDQGKPDNYLYVRHTIMAFDFGGSFMFRSIGGKKGKDGQLPFGLKNFKDMIRTDSFHFRKDMYRHLESFPKELESAMHRVVISLSPRIIEQHVHAAGFSDLTLANEIILVLNQSRNYLIHRLAFVFLQQRRINDIPLKLEYVFDILNTDVSPVILEDAVEKRLSSAQSIRHLMPAFHHLSSLTAGEATGKNLTGYQTRVLGTGRYISLLQRNENGPELSFEEMNTVSARLGAGQYEKAIISWMRTHAGFVDDIMAICTRQNTSFLEKAENVQAYISGIFGKSTFSDDINPEIFIHDLLSVCCYFANSSAQQYHYFAITNLERYRYNLSENLLHTSLDI
ncbi:MAG: hypothetical protein JXB03_08615 [Spirochaetales bacterium]|nr:hypothetical protein [Spirochaetales bacterium]